MPKVKRAPLTDADLDAIEERLDSNLEKLGMAIRKQANQRSYSFADALRLRNLAQALITAVNAANSTLQLSRSLLAHGKEEWPAIEWDEIEIDLDA